MKKHRNIPIFVPHLGCPNTCVFCNQRKISGCEKADFSSVSAEIEEALSTEAFEVTTWTEGILILVLIGGALILLPQFF